MHPQPVLKALLAFVRSRKVAKDVVPVNEPSLKQRSRVLQPPLGLTRVAAVSAQLLNEEYARGNALLAQADVPVGSCKRLPLMRCVGHDAPRSAFMYLTRRRPWRLRHRGGSAPS